MLWALFHNDSQAQNRAGEAYDSAAKTVSQNTQVAKDRASEAMDSTKAQAQVCMPAGAGAGK